MNMNFKYIHLKNNKFELHTSEIFCAVTVLLKDLVRLS